MVVLMMIKLNRRVKIKCLLRMLMRIMPRNAVADSDGDADDVGNMCASVIRAPE